MSNIVESYKSYIKNYASIKGCSSRKDYWLVVLANCLISFVLGLLSGLFVEVKAVAGIFSLLMLVYSLFTIVPSFTLCIRRLHDINKSGWFLLLGLIPFVGPLILIVFYCLPSVTENNQFLNNSEAK